MTEREDRFSRELGQDAYLEDGGFTQAVLGRLPPRRQGLRRVILIGFGLLSAGALALCFPMLDGLAVRALGVIMGSPALAAAAVACLAVVLGLELERA